MANEVQGITITIRRLLNMQYMGNNFDLETFIGILQLLKQSKYVNKIPELVKTIDIILLTIDIYNNIIGVLEKLKALVPYINMATKIAAAISNKTIIPEILNDVSQQAQALIIDKYNEIVSSLENVILDYPITI